MSLNIFAKKLSVAACMLLIYISSAAQGGHSVKMVLSDKDNSEPVAFATVSATPQGAEKAVKYVLSDDKGAAKIEGLKAGTYTIKAELLGYKPFVKEVKVDKNVDLGTSPMEPDNQVLDAASVSAVGNPIVVKKDTIEYNASSFKTTDNDMLEDLLKKLPGVEVSSDGSVTANGKAISKITIDGKTFFLDDPSLASKNIPAKIINKVKVVDKKSDQALFTGIDDGEEETIIDLSVRPGMMKGLFGNVMAGGGHDVPSSRNAISDTRYQGAAMVGRFTDKSQLSLILNANNTNNRGFNDMAGSMMQGMRGGGGMGRGAGGWGGGNGITTSWMGGLNGAWTLFDGDMDLGGNYLYNGSNRLVQESSSKTTFLDNGNTLRYNSTGSNNTHSEGHRFGLRLEHKFSDKTSILFQPQVNFGKGYYSELSRDTTFSNQAVVPTNKGFSSNNGNNNNWSTSGFLLFRQRIGQKAGRTISLMTRYSFSENKLDGFNQSLSQTMNEEQKWTGTPTNQRFDSHSNNSSLSGRLVYTEPLADSLFNGKGKLFLELNASYSWTRNNTIKDVFDSGEYRIEDFGPDNLFYNPVGEMFNETYSNNIRNQYQNQEYGTNIQYQTQKLRLQAGAAFLPTITDNTTNGENYHSMVYNWSPQAMVSYDISDNSSLRMFYRGRSSQPSTNQLMPVPDNSNPLSISFGNPYLKPYFNHSVDGRFGFTNKETFLSFHMNFNASLVQNNITNAVWYSQQGVQFAMPLNGRGTGNAGFGTFIHIPIAKSNFSIQNNLNMSFSSSSSYVGKSERSQQFTQTYYNETTKKFDYEMFNRDFLDHSKAGSAKYELEDFFTDNRTRSLSVTERIQATYRNDFIDIELSGRTRFNKPWYTIVSEGTQGMTWNNQVSAEVIWTSSFGLGIKPRYNFNWYVGYVTPQESTHNLELEISQLAFKNKCTFAVRGYDLLNQTRNLYVTDNANYHQETRNNTLGRYIIFSLTYRFGNFDRGGRGGAPGGHGGPRGPMGGPGGPGGGPRR